MALNFPASPSVNQAYTSNNHSWIWNGVTWVTNNSNIYTTFPFDEFSGNGSTVTYSLSRSPIGNSAIVVTVSGVTQIPDGTSYNVSANQLTFSSPPPVGTNNIVVLYLGSYSLVSSATTINPISANTSSGPFNPILVNTSSSNATPYVANTFQFVSSNGYFATSGNVFVNGSLTVGGNVTFQNTTINNVTVNTTDQLVTTNTSTSISTTTGSIVAYGGIGIAGNVYVGGTITGTLANTGVTSGTYGGATNIPVLVVNAGGQIISASNVAVTTGTALTDDITTATVHYPLLTTSTSGSISIANTSSTKLTYVPSTGTLSATVMSSTSDRNLKENIKIIENALDVVNGIDGVRYNWKDSRLPSAGLIAQQVGIFMPELVIIDNKGNQSLNYNGIIGVLVEAIKELNSKVDKLEGKQ